MSQGKVTVNNLNLGQGNFPEIERVALFIGVGTKNVGSILSINTQSDLVDLLGVAGSNTGIKAQVTAARANGGENWQAYAAPIGAGDDWQDALISAMAVCSPELVAVCVPATTDDDLLDAHTIAEQLRTQYARRVVILLATPGIDTATQTWAAYEAAQALITADVSAYRVAAVPLLHNNDLGVLAGRLCNRAVSVADSPMRVETGPVIALGATPVDSTGKALPAATLTALDANRLSVIQRYVDYPGTFWGDCNLLDEPAGDYQVIEHLRVVDKVARRIRPLAIKRIANRSLNDSAISIAANKTYFMRPLREMSERTAFAGNDFPGDIQSPADDSISIVWPSLNQVQVFFKVRPYKCPKDITANIVLDLKA